MRIFRIVFWVIILSIIVFTIILIAYPSKTEGATNISATTTDHFAWNEVSGWWNFFITDTVMVTNTKIEGFASSSIGEVSFDCATSPNGNMCSTSNYGVTNNVANGKLMGYAWNDLIGWISVSCENHETPPCSFPYQTVIDIATGDFSGWAWNDIVGWISFGSPPTYKVNTSWRGTTSSIVGYLESQIFDTRTPSGAQLNGVIWQGEQPSNASGNSSVDFQIAASNSSSGPWTFQGPEGSPINYYGMECPGVGQVTPAAGPGKSICVDQNLLKNYRYLRYKIRLQSTPDRMLSPLVDDIILNWSR
ncbi:MAG: hypothetical protein QMD50_00195 [Patescibacteria group bacterium]|nr:hypothetical protein [Patescibacteria group bacterium]